jgi:hypothetical protein
MITELRKKFNNNFSEKKYENFLKELDSALKYPTDFRVSETPLFLSNELTEELAKASSEILSQIQANEFKEKSEDAIPKGLEVANEDSHPLFLQIDFAICKEKDQFLPKLIELQGFPSLYGYQYFFDKILRKHFDIPEGMSCYFNGFEGRSYVEFLKKIIVGKNEPERVIILEIEPEKQKTRIDFAATEELLGIKAVDISSLKKQGRKLFYPDNGKDIPIERIYNRVIFDELQRKNIRLPFNLSEELEVTWAGHPNWFFKISKYSLPLLKGNYVPKCYYLKELDRYPSNLQDYVLKPLFSFAGLGVEVDPSKELLDSIKDRSNYILQEKIEYAPLIETPNGYSKVEIRMMFLWEERPVLVNNLVRMSKGKMMGVDFNKNKTWVGSSVAYHY